MASWRIEWARVMRLLKPPKDMRIFLLTLRVLSGSFLIAPVAAEAAVGALALAGVRITLAGFFLDGGAKTTFTFFRVLVAPPAVGAGAGVAGVEGVGAAVAAGAAETTDAAGAGEVSGTTVADAGTCLFPPVVRRRFLVPVM